MVLVTHWHVVLFAVLVPDGFFGSEVVEVGSHLNIFSRGLVLLDFHYFLHSSLNIEGLGVHTKAPIAYLRVAENVLDIEHQQLGGVHLHALTFVDFGEEFTDL